MKSYKLLKDLPGTKAGTIFTKCKVNDLPKRITFNVAPWYSPEGKWLPQFFYSEMENPKWFMEMVEFKDKPKTQYLECPECDKPGIQMDLGPVGDEGFTMTIHRRCTKCKHLSTMDEIYEAHPFLKKGR